MLLTMIVIALILLWLSGYFGPPVIPEIALPTLHIAWSNSWTQAVLIIVVIIVVASLVRR